MSNLLKYVDVTVFLEYVVVLSLSIFTALAIFGLVSVCLGVFDGKSKRK